MHQNYFSCMDSRGFTSFHFVIIFDLYRTISRAKGTFNLIMKRSLSHWQRDGSEFRVILDSGRLAPEACKGLNIASHVKTRLLIRGHLVDAVILASPSQHQGWCRFQFSGSHISHVSLDLGCRI